MFKRVASLGMLLLIALTLSAGDIESRHGVAPDLRSYPQATAKEALASVVKAVDAKRFDYLLAHLADPTWVDERAGVLAGGFKEMVREATERFDAPTVKRLKRYLEEGDFETLDAQAVVRLKNGKDRVVRLRKVNARWYIQNENRP